MALPETFTGENGLALNVYSALWVSNSAHTGVLEVQSNRAVLRASPAASACYLYDQSPASADYYVEATISVTNASQNGGLVIRASKTASTFYQFRWNGGAFQIYKFVAGAATQLGGDVTQGLSTGTDYVFRVECSGSDIIGYLDGVEKIRCTDTSITTAGYGGIRVNSGSTGMTFDNFDVSNMGGGSGTTIACNQGSASASGFAASIIAATTIACSLGGATASGYQATIQEGANVVIACALGSAAASGYSATITSAGSVTITSDVFKNNTGTVLSGLTVPKVWAIPLGTPDFTNLVTDGSGVLTITSGALSAGDYLLVTAAADGTIGGVSKVTAA